VQKSRALSKPARWKQWSTLVVKIKGTDPLKESPFQKKLFQSLGGEGARLWQGLALFWRALF
jgi:hypothetical protein